MSVGDGASTVSAGWYPDPADEARLRRWDGQAWTQDVILAPEQAPVGFIAPRSNPTPTETLAPPVPSATQPAPSQAPPPPPVASPPASFVPTASAPAASAPASPAPASQVPSAPRAAGASGSASFPEWASLPGITLPPDLSSIPGFRPETIVLTPTFEDPIPEPEPAPAPSSAPQQAAPPPPPASFDRQPFEPAPNDAQASGAPAAPPSTAQVPPTPTPPPPAAPMSPPAAAPSDFPPPPTPPRRGGSQPAPAENYAPPPHGAQYDVPPPPGAARVPGPQLALPASSLVSQRTASPAWSSAPDATRSAQPPADFDSLPRTTVAAGALDTSGGVMTMWAWIIALLPLIQFAAVYVAYAELAVAFAPGIQWAILAAPALAGLLLAEGDRRKLVAIGANRPPSPLLAIVPPIYLLVRAVDVGRSSAVALVIWVLLQAGAVAATYLLLPHLLAKVIASLH